MKRKFRHILCLVAASILMASCHHEIYNPNNIRDRFFMQDVPANFDWSALASVKVNITPDDHYDGNYFYIIEIFGKNPIVSPDAARWGTGVTKGSLPYQSTITLPDAVSTLYIRQTDPQGKKRVAMATVSNNQLSYSFAPITASISSHATKAVFSSTDNDFEPDDSQYAIPELPTSGLSAFNPAEPVIQNGKDYILEGEYSGKIQFEWGEKKSRLFITGTWNNTQEETSLSANTQLIVLPGGKIQSQKDWDIKPNSNSSIFIAKDGQIGNKNRESISIKYTNPGNLINQGKLYLDKLSTSSNASVYNSGELILEEIEQSNPQEFINRGTVIVEEMKTSGSLRLYNSGTFRVTEKMENNNPSVLKNTKLLWIHDAKINGGQILNYDSIYVKELECENVQIYNFHKITASEELEFKRSKIFNECRIEAKELELEQSQLELSAQTSVECEKLESDGSRISIGSGALFVATDKAEFTPQRSTICGSGEKEGLLRLEEIEWKEGKWNHLLYTGNLEIDCQKFEDNELYESLYYILEAPAHFAENGTITFIPAGECTGSGNITEDGPNEDPQFPILDRIRQPYNWILEDIYPDLGDYDMNDLVVSIDSIDNLITQENKIIGITLHLRVRAVGALQRIGAALQLDGTSPTNIKGVTYSDNLHFTDETFETDAQGTEKGQTYAVIPLFDNAHDVLGLPDHRTITNTISTGKTGHLNKAATSFSITIGFNQAIDPEYVMPAKLNLFAIVENRDGFRNLEIHLPGFAHSDKSRVAEEVQEVTQGLMWSLLLPQQFKYAEEKTDIRKAYPKFQNWVKSNKEKDKDWYNHPVTEYIYKP